MWPPPWMIDQIKRREQQRREDAGVPLHIPAPEPAPRERPEAYPAWEPEARDDRQPSTSGGVIIIDLNDFTETRM